MAAPNPSADSHDAMAPSAQSGFAGGQRRRSLNAIRRYVYSDGARRREARPLDGIIEARPEGLSQGRKRAIGQALYAAQRGEEYPSVKALRAFGGRTVLEVVAPYHADAYRAVYTVRFHDAIHVLHAFQKKPTSGIATVQQDIDLVRKRLATAERDHRERQTSR